MIYNHLNSPYLSLEGLLRQILLFIANDIGEILNPAIQQYLERRGKTRQRRSTLNVNDPRALWDTSWGRMLEDPRLRDPHSYKSRQFRRRFRMPYNLFVHVVNRCKEDEVFGKTKIPYEFRVLVQMSGCPNVPMLSKS